MILTTTMLLRLCVGGRYKLTINSYQARLLGLGWPLKRGWVSRLVGTDVTTNCYLTALAIRGQSKERRKEILKEHGYNAAKLFQKGLE